MKRIFWFSVGAASGFGGAVYGYGRLRRYAGRSKADQVADGFVRIARGGIGAARGFVDDTREAVREAEQELRARPSLSEHSPRQRFDQPPGPQRLARPSRRNKRHVAGVRGELDSLDGGEP